MRSTWYLRFGKCQRRRLRCNVVRSELRECGEFVPRRSWLPVVGESLGGCLLEYGWTAPWRSEQIVKWFFIVGLDCSHSVRSGTARKPRRSFSVTFTAERFENYIASELRLPGTSWNEFRTTKIISPCYRPQKKRPHCVWQIGTLSLDSPQASLVEKETEPSSTNGSRVL